MSNWYVGQKVVCVIGGRIAGSGFGPEIMPVAGCVYTVRGIETGDGASVGLLLEEIRNAPMEYLEGLYECSFSADRFRPLDTLDSTLERLEKEGNELVRELEPQIA